VIRLRLFPAHGLIYGDKENLEMKEEGTTLKISPERVVYKGNGVDTWETYKGDTDPFSTSPGGLERPGWFDDTCDGIITVTIGSLKAKARFATSPPDYVPQSHHVRSGLDEFEQMLLGPALPKELPDDPDVRQDHINSVIRIIRSALETMRNMNPEYLNASYARGSFNSQRVNYDRVLSTHGFYLGMARQLASSDPQRFSQAQAELERLGDQLRNYLETYDRSPDNRRKMPALMRGGDSNDLCLTRRQQEFVRRSKELKTP